jgi:hypothetical protein
LLVGRPFADPHGAKSGAVSILFGGDPGRLQISLDGASASFADPDGDKVTLRTSKGAFTKEMLDMRFERLGFQLEKLDLSDAVFNRATIEISAVRQDANNDGTLDGNGRVDVGYLNATGVDLRSVTIGGDLGQIDCGDGNPLKPAIKSLNVRSLGERNTSTQDSPVANLHSDIAGDLEGLTVKRGITGGATFAVAGRIGVATIGGDFGESTISALGALLPQTAAEAIAIQTLSVGGNVTESHVLAGYDRSGLAVNADASIGKVKVIGHWTSSDLVAGIIDSTNDGFGRNDVVITGGSSSIIAEIAKLVIKGSTTGSAHSNGFFGITTEAIAFAKIGGTAVSLTEGKDNLLLDQMNGNFRLLEV